MSFGMGKGKYPAQSDKVEAKRYAKAAKVPVFPGSEGAIEEEEEAVEVAAEIGYPVIIKAAAGGGGRGMRVCHNEATLRTNIKKAQQEDNQRNSGDAGGEAEPEIHGESLSLFFVNSVWHKRGGLLINRPDKPHHLLHRLQADAGLSGERRPGRHVPDLGRPPLGSVCAAG